jgi:hypothetical protein
MEYIIKKLGAGPIYKYTKIYAVNLKIVKYSVNIKIQRYIYKTIIPFLQKYFACCACCACFDCCACCACCAPRPGASRVPLEGRRGGVKLKLYEFID